MKKNDYDKILFRLTNIWQRLRESEILSVKELAEEFNVSTKTIQRDFNERLIHLLPIEKSGHNWKVTDGHSIDKNLSLEEDIVLDVLKEIAKSMGTDFGYKASSMFSKLQNSHDNPIYSKIEIEDILDKTYIIEQLQKAISNSTQVKFHYKDKTRLVEPYKITAFEGYWYLYANDIKVNKLKTYYIKDINKLIITDNSFKKSDLAQKKLEAALNVWFEPNAEFFDVRLLAKPDIAKYFKRRPLSKSQIITKEFQDGSLEIFLQATSENEVIYELKKWQPSLLVIEPKSITKKILKMSQEFFTMQSDLIS